MNVSVLFKVLPFKGFCNLCCVFFQQEMVSSILTNLPKRKDTSTASPSSLRITPWNLSHSIDFKDNHNHSKRIIDISAFLSYILHNSTTHACKRLLLNIFLNDHLVFEEDHGVEEEGSKDRDDANEGPQLQGGHGWVFFFQRWFYIVSCFAASCSIFSLSTWKSNLFRLLKSLHYCQWHEKRIKRGKWGTRK